MPRSTPNIFAAIAAISPAIWTSCAQANAANAGAYASAAAFRANDLVTHAASLAGIPVRVASGYDDPFYPGVQSLDRALPAGAAVDLAGSMRPGIGRCGQRPTGLILDVVITAASVKTAWRNSRMSGPRMCGEISGWPAS